MSQPNIVLIISDDHGYADRSARGTHDEVRTPNLDRLADSGMTFEQGYVSAPVCSPSRAGLITGTQSYPGAAVNDRANMAFGSLYPRSRIPTAGYTSIRYTEITETRGTPPLQ